MRFCNALLQQGVHHAAASGASSRLTVIAPVFAFCSYCERYAETMCPGASNCVTPKSLPSTCRIEEKSGLFEISGFCSNAANSTSESAVQVCNHDSPTHTRAQKTQSRHHQHHHQTPFRRARRVTRCWTSGSSGAYHTTVGKRIFVANHASSAITYVYMLASRVRQAQEIQLHGASMHANVVPVYTQQERGDRSYRRIGRTSCTQCLLPCRSP